MADNVLDGVYGYTDTSGTGAYVINADQPGFRTWASIPDGTTAFITVKTATQFEQSLAAKGTSGPNATLTPTEIVRNNVGTKIKIDWAPGQKIVSAVISAEYVAMLNAVNIWLAHQRYRGSRLCLSADDATYWHSDTNDEAALVANDIEVFRLTAGTGNLITHTLADSGSVAGPSFRSFRDSGSPAIADQTGEILFSARNSAAALKDFARVVGVLRGITAGAELGELNIRAMVAGAEVDLARFAGDRIAMFPLSQSSTRALMVGKAAQSVTTVGGEALADGSFVSVTTGAAPINFIMNRLVNDGIFMSFRQDGTEEGAISISGTTISYSPFIGDHPTLMLEEMELPPSGSVLCSTDVPYSDKRWHLPRVRLSNARGERRVCGILKGLRENDEPLMYGVGVWAALVKGPVTGGDLLWSSDDPGVAEVQPDDIIRAHTIGKVQIADSRADARLVPCTLMCG